MSQEPVHAEIMSQTFLIFLAKIIIFCFIWEGVITSIAASAGTSAPGAAFGGTAMAPVPRLQASEEKPQLWLRNHIYTEHHTYVEYHNVVKSRAELYEILQKTL